ncbi:hypothetical protein L1987_16951 [Smallanthus sonchifolius]|uniref:Uncharacterized protein n=1 Tax=Smallanthus sonchifolius TaxID=185202 RepID=A0ACB9IVH1_9ASTR|nr:hypothetical protein L1987_16951 [Smallanthus sonchifolius]
MSSQSKNISVSTPSSSSGLMRQQMEQQKKTNQMLFKELERVKESKKPAEVTTPLKSRILDFNYSGSPGVHRGNFLPMHSGITTAGPTPAEIGITLSMAKELKKLREMISSVPGVVQPIPEISSTSHRISRFAPPLCDAEIPKRFQTPNMKLYDGTTDPEEHVAQNRALRFIRLEDDKKIQQRVNAPTSYTQPNPKAEPAPFRSYRSKQYSKPANHRVNAVEDDEEEYPKLWPRKFERNPGGKDKSNWCAFHEDFGHITEDCIALRKEISYLLSKGYLKEFLGKGKNKTKDHDRIPQRAKSPPPDAKVIGFISGGSDICGTSYSAAKRNAKEAKTKNGDRPIRTSSLTTEKVICFDEDDRNDVQDSHHDGLVITLYIANHFIRRILIDGGSSVNIIQHEVLKRMGIPDSEIISKSSVLVGFNGEVKSTVGEIKLPIYIEGVNSIQKFCVIDSLSCYNVILGRPWIHNMKAVPSIYHHCVKMPTLWEWDVLETKEHDVKEVSLDAENPDVKILVGSNIPGDIEKDILNFLRARKATFA